MTLVVEKCAHALETFTNWPIQIQFKNVPFYSKNPYLRRNLTDVVKYIENKLREQKGFRGRLKVKNLDPQITSLIDRFFATEQARTSAPVPEISIDLDKVASLVNESNQVLDMLKAEEDVISKYDEQVGSQEETHVEDVQIQEIEIPIELLDALENPVSEQDFPEDGTMWQAFAENLSVVQIQVLSAVLTEASPQKTIRKLADVNMTMESMLIDGINELSQDHIDDILLDTEPSVHISDDYYAPFVTIIVERLRSK